MRAMVISSFGGPEVFEARDLDKPAPGAGEVLVKVHATSVNPADMGVRQGMFGPSVKLPAVLGFDVSGVVEEVGDGVGTMADNVRVGDEVYYAIPKENVGANAEYHVAPASMIAKKPANLSHLQAASVPVAGGTAWAALVTRARVGVGESVLIHGGAGGVGSFAVQIAKAAGAYVYATCGSYDAELVTSLGADRVIDYRNEDFVEIIGRETAGRGVDVSLTTVGGDALARSLNVTAADGRAVTVTGPLEGLERNLFAAMGKNITLHFVHFSKTREKLEALRKVIERGQVRAVIGASYPLERVAEAHRRLEKGGEGVYGKIAIEVAQGNSPT